MKALTLTQPWATLVAIEAKRIETRSWTLAYRGPIAIHAAKGMPSYAVDAFWHEPFYSTLVAAGITKPTELPRGVVLATARLVAVQPTSANLAEIHARMDAKEFAFGDYSPGRYMWLLDSIVRLPEPAPAKGSLGLWEWNP